MEGEAQLSRVRRRELVGSPSPLAFVRQTLWDGAATAAAQTAVGPLASVRLRAPLCRRPQTTVGCPWKAPSGPARLAAVAAAVVVVASPAAGRPLGLGTEAAGEDTLAASTEQSAAAPAAAGSPLERPAGSSVLVDASPVHWRKGTCTPEGVEEEQEPVEDAAAQRGAAVPAGAPQDIQGVELGTRVEAGAGTVAWDTPSSSAAAAAAAVDLAAPECPAAAGRGPSMEVEGEEEVALARPSLIRLDSA